MMTVLVTGAAGFIGFHVASALLARGEAVIGIDDLNPYYDIDLKRARLALLQEREGFRFLAADISRRDVFDTLAASDPEIDRVVHLAAQAGVRHSLDQPRAYVNANIVGHLELLEFVRGLRDLRHFVYASSSSVYGASPDLPFSPLQPCDGPQSLYAATKRADELMSFAYSHLFALPATGLRFFTVYGPWGRPDMAPMIFAKAVLEGQPITLFNAGDMERDFTFVDDAVAGTLAALDRPPSGSPPHRLFNIGNHRAEPLRRFLELIEKACGLEAKLLLAPMQPGDVRRTFADISASQKELGYEPRTSIEEGIPRFVAWFRDFYRL